MNAEALSKAPLFSPGEVEDININKACVCLAKSSFNSQLDVIFNAIDSDYLKLRQDVQNQSFQSVYANQLKAVMPQLSVDKDLVYLDATKIVLHKNVVKSVLPLMHMCMCIGRSEERKTKFAIKEIYKRMCIGLNWRLNPEKYFFFIIVSV